MRDMYQFLFKNRWIAIAFVVMTLVSVRAIVGGEGEDSLLSRTQKDLAAQRAGIKSAMADLDVDPESIAAQQVAAPVSTDPIIGFTPDEELVDNASGFDPTPEIEDAGEFEVQLVDSDAEPGA